VGVFLSEHSVV